MRGEYQLNVYAVMLKALYYAQAMLARVKDVQKDVDKLASGNETLQMYIDNLTLQMAKRR